MTMPLEVTPTKTHRGENFPVASLLITPRHRKTVLAFYRFARAADDIADHSSLSDAAKFSGLDALEQSLLGVSDVAPAALSLRRALADCSLSPRHAQDLLKAFRLDVTKRRYENFDELIEYCTYSAMPVGRFVLDVHGEDQGIWPASDALCTALQVINHLQDCGKDYRMLDRVYIPSDMMARHGAKFEDLSAARASAPLRRCIKDVVERTRGLLEQAAPFASLIRNVRLGLEVSVIHRLACSLTKMLAHRDPLRERVHLNALEVAALSLAATTQGAFVRMRRLRPASGRTLQGV
jgi:squalene synthase HpnC